MWSIVHANKRPVSIVAMYFFTNTQNWQYCHYYRPQTKLRKGNVFTSVCQEFCPQGGVYASMHWGRHPRAGTHHPRAGTPPWQVHYPAGTPPMAGTPLGRYTP